MSDMHFPWLEASILTPLIGALFLWKMDDRYQARKWCVYLTGVTFVLAVGAWQDFYLTGAKDAGDAPEQLAEVRWAQLQATKSPRYFGLWLRLVVGRTFQRGRDVGQRGSRMAGGLAGDLDDKRDCFARVR